MAKKEKNTISLKEALRVHLRAMKDIHKVCPKLFPAIFLTAVVTAVIPYVTVALSARIITELSTLRRSEVLWRWVVITVSVTGALSLLNVCLTNWCTTQITLFRQHKEKLFVDKALSMDYANKEKQSARDLRSQLMQNENYGGLGLVHVPYYVFDMVAALIGILSAVVLTWSLFTLLVPESGGGLTVLNNPLFVLVLFGVMLGISALAGLCDAKASSYIGQIAQEGTLGNRIFSFFGFMGSERERRVDARIYNQHRMARYYNEMDRSYSPEGIGGKLTFGPIGIFSGLSSGVSAIFTGFAYLFTCLKAIGGAFGVGAVTQYVGAVTTLSGNISELFAISGKLRSNTKFMHMTYQYLDMPNAMYQGSLTTEKRADRQYEVEFKDVSFQYPGTDTWALRHVNMKFRVGQRLAVVGENGSGKTTFIKLLCRLYDPQEGEILLNGIDIRKYDYRDYMNIFSVVFQDFQLIAQPLGANVAGAATYDRDRVEKALVDAGFGDRLKEMPKGLDTYLYKELDKEGVEISGGEAQKIAIARALYKDAPFIILDEPTAALDPLAEAEIYSKFDAIAGDRTAVYISHRLSSCKFCDEIAVFDHGAVIQQGSHESLLSDQNGKYHELWNAQAQYYAQEAETAEG